MEPLYEDTLEYVIVPKLSPQYSSVNETAVKERLLNLLGEQR
jgi:hypothetical protein